MSRQLCPHHPDVDYRHAWGCPDCVRELRAKLDAAERVAAEMRKALTDARSWVVGDTRDKNASRAALAKQTVPELDRALSSEAGRDYVPKAEWLRLGEALNEQSERWGLYGESSQRALKDFLAARDARKESTE